MAYIFHTTQQLHCDIDRAWEFFSSPHNLSRITPKEMKFTVLAGAEHKDIYPGMLIDYTVAPLLGIPLHWRTEIEEVLAPTKFVDLQQKGPYKFWRHTHEFIPNDEGVCIKDTVEYDLPFGFLGQIAHWLVVKKKIAAIFDYRHQVLEELFNQNALNSTAP